MGTDTNNPDKLFAYILDLKSNFVRNTGKQPTKLYLQPYQLDLIRNWYPHMVRTVDLRESGFNVYVADMEVYKVMSPYHKITVCRGESNAA